MQWEGANRAEFGALAGLPIKLCRQRCASLNTGVVNCATMRGMNGLLARESGIKGVTSSVFARSRAQEAQNLDLAVAAVLPVIFLRSTYVIRMHALILFS